MSWKLKSDVPCRDKYLEYTYAETVEVINGFATVNTITAKQYMLCSGYSLVEDEEPVDSTLSEATEE